MASSGTHTCGVIHVIHHRCVYIVVCTHVQVLLARRPYGWRLDTGHGQLERWPGRRMLVRVAIKSMQLKSMKVRPEIGGLLLATRANTQRGRTHVIPCAIHVAARAWPKPANSDTAWYPYVRVTATGMNRAATPATAAQHRHL